MKFQFLKRPATILLTVVSLALSASATGKEPSGQKIPAEIFDPGFLEGDSNYHSITAAADGIIVGSRNRRIFFSESLLIGPDDHIYTVA